MLTKKKLIKNNNNTNINISAMAIPAQTNHLNLYIKQELNHKIHTWIIRYEFFSLGLNSNRRFMATMSTETFYFEGMQRQKCNSVVYELWMMYWHSHVDVDDVVTVLKGVINGCKHVGPKWRVFEG